jgi:hypothetical protein
LNNAFFDRASPEFAAAAQRRKPLDPGPPVAQIEASA